MRSGKLASLCAMVHVLVALSPCLLITFTDGLSVKRRPSILPQPKRQAQKYFRWTVSSSIDSNENNLPENETTQQSSSHVGSASIQEEVSNLVKAIIGAGALSIPAGIALMAGNNSHGLVLSTSCLLIALMGGLSAYTFSLIARVCEMTDSSTYADCWSSTKGKSMAWIVALSTTLDCFAISLTYSMVLADTFPQLFSALFKLGESSRSSLFATMAAHNSRSKVLLLVTSTILLPLCCVKNISKLAPFSLVGILGMLYTGIVIGIRYFDGSYGVPNGRFLADLKSLPSLVSSGAIGSDKVSPFPLLNPKSLILISILSRAYITHFNAPKFFRELKDADTNPKRFHLGVVLPSFGVSVLFYALVSSLGYLTFGSATQGVILSNYSTKDILISLSRFAVGLSLIFSYPLFFAGLRDGIIDLINQIRPLFSKEDKANQKQLVLTDRQSNRFTVGLVSLITILALNVTDITFVASLSGALLSTAQIFIFPPLMFRSAIKMKNERAAKPFTRRQKWERRLCSVIVGLGVFVAGVGTKIALTT